MGVRWLRRDGGPEEPPRLRDPEKEAEKEAADGQNENLKSHIKAKERNVFQRQSDQMLQKSSKMKLQKGLGFLKA